jgi:lia operon protein LiaG
MKTRIIIIGTLFITFTANVLTAKEYKIPVENTKEGILSLSGFGENLVIEGYNGTDIVFSTTSEEYEVPERAKGLKPVYPGGTDNTGIGLSVEKIENQIKVTCLLPMTKKDNYTIKVPENLTIKVQGECHDNTNIFITRMKNEIEIKNCQDINLMEVSGPLVLSTISGNINISFDNINMDKPSSINSISGEIDIALPSKIKADIELQSVTGTMYTDFDISTSNKGMRRVGGNQLSFELNGGGTTFSIVTVSGNIYLRKSL